MKNYDLFLLAENLNAKMPELMKLKGAKFSYALTKNLDLLESELKLISSTSKPTDEFTKYDKERIALCEKFAKKDDKGDPLKKELTNGQFEFDIDIQDPNWITTINKLKEDNQSLIEDREKQIIKYNELLEIDSSVQFHLININEIDDNITTELMRIIKPFIKEY